MLYRAGFATVAAAAALAFASVTAQAQKCGDIELGAAVSATGIYASNGQNTKNGYEFALKKINDAGGVTIGGKCYHFKIKYYDDESTPARAAQLVERLIDQDKIKYMLGPYGSPLAKAILPVTEKYKTPLVQGEAASRSLFTQGYKYHFGIVATSEKYLTPVVDMAAEHRQAGRQGSVDREDRDDLPGRRLLARRAPGVVDADEEVQDEGGGRRPHAEGLERHHRLLHQGEGAQARRADRFRPREGRRDRGARKWRELKIQVPLVGITHCESAKVTQDFPKSSEGFVCPTQWDETMKIGDPLFGTAAKYNKQIKAAYNYKVVPYQTAQATAAVLRLEGCVRAGQFARQGEGARGADQDRPRDLLRHVKFADDGSNPGKEMAMRQIQQGKYKVVWPENVAAAKLIYPREAQY